MKLSARNTFQKGFTLIELLVVIGILGILAAALVATIDPFEQLRKAEDSRSQNVAVEFHNALIRYYTGQLAMPWEVAAETGGDCDLEGTTTDVEVGTTIDDLSGEGCLDVLIGIGELKEAFDTAAGLENVYVTEPYTGAAVDGSVSVCYQSVSKSGMANPNNRYDQGGAIIAECPDTPPTGGCYWCAE